MKPRRFDYIRPDTVAEALDILAERGPEARVMAGGQSLMAMLNLRLIEPAVIVDISRIAELAGIKDDGKVVEIGAAVTQAQVEHWPALAERLPFVARALPWVGHFQTRNRGTVCGSIAHADPSSELPLALRMLDGEVVLRSRSGTRVLPASEFQLGMLTTARADDELVTAVRLPAGVGTAGVAFREVARRHGDFALVSVGAVLREHGGIRIAAGGLADTPQILDLSQTPSEAELEERIDAFAWQLGGFEDLHASARYRRDLLRRLAPVVVREALSCAG